MTRPLHILGREFAGFERAFTRQLAAIPELPASFELIEISRLQAGLVDGDTATSGAIDILLCSTDWLSFLIQAGRLLALDDRLRDDPPEGWPDAWAPSLRRLQTGPDGSCYGIAYHDGPMLTLYRTDLYRDRAERSGFEKRFGYPLGPPTTWAEYRDQALWFNRPEQGLYGTVLAGYPDEHNTVYDFLMHLWSRGGELFDDEGHPALRSAAARAAAEFVCALWHRDRVIDPAAAGWDSVASGVHFANGEAAMMVNWAGFAALSADPASPTHGLVGCAPAPGGVTMNSYWVLAIPAGCERPDDAYRLIRRLAAPDMDRITSLEGGSGARRDTWADPEIQRLAPYYEVLEQAHAGARSLPQDATWPSQARAIDHLMGRIVAGAPVEAALAEADEALRP